jgi:hypothetical protein
MLFSHLEIDFIGSDEEETDTSDTQKGDGIETPTVWLNKLPDVIMVRRNEDML